MGDLPVWEISLAAATAAASGDLRMRPAAAPSELRKKPAAQPAVSSDKDFTVNKEGMAKCRPYKKASYLLNGGDKKSVCNVTAKAAAQDYDVVCKIFDWINWINQQEGDVKKSEAEAYKRELLGRSEDVN